MARIRIMEVGPRDGLQNEKTPVPTADKARFVRLLAGAGLARIEAASFVRPGVIPQLADAAELWPEIRDVPAELHALIPNLKGLENARAAGVRHAAVFTAASGAFTLKNTNCTLKESLGRTKAVVEAVREADLPPPRAYISTVITCPYAGPVRPQAVLDVALELEQQGVSEISLGETLGVAVPDDISRLLDVLLPRIPAERLAGHFHDTRGTALANTFRALELGLRTFDSSCGGLGGCPYAPGAAGNLATEDLVYALHRSGHETGVDPNGLLEAGRFMSRILNRTLPSRVLRAPPAN